MMPCALPPDSLGSSSGEHPEETGKEKGADQMARQVRGTYRPQSVSGSGPPLEGRLVTPKKVLFAAW